MVTTILMNINVNAPYMVQFHLHFMITMPKFIKNKQCWVVTLNSIQACIWFMKFKIFFVQCVYKNLLKFAILFFHLFHPSMHQIVLILIHPSSIPCDLIVDICNPYDLVDQFLFHLHSFERFVCKFCENCSNLILNTLNCWNVFKYYLLTLKPKLWFLVHNCEHPSKTTLGSHMWKSSSMAWCSLVAYI